MRAADIIFIDAAGFRHDDIFFLRFDDGHYAAGFLLFFLFYRLIDYHTLIVTLMLALI